MTSRHVTPEDRLRQLADERKRQFQGRARAAQFEGVRSDLPEPEGSALDVNFAAGPLIGLQKAVPALRGEGFAEFERLRAGGLDIGNALAQAYQAQDLPSTRIDVTPGFHIPLPGGRRFDEVDVGFKGAFELAADPTNLLPIVGVGGDLARLSRGLRGVGPDVARMATGGVLDRVNPLISEVPARGFTPTRDTSSPFIRSVAGGAGETPSPI